MRILNSCVTRSLMCLQCCVVALSLFSSDILTWSGDSSWYSVQWHLKRMECIYKNMHSMSTNFAKTLALKYEYVVKLWRHKQRIPKTNDHYLLLNETPLKIFCIRHCLHRSEKILKGLYSKRLKTKHQVFVVLLQALQATYVAILSKWLPVLRT